MKNQFLLLEDVHGLGRRGDIVTVKRPGFARNFLLPQKKAIIAQTHLVRFQEKLREERAEQAVVDKKDATALAQSLTDKVLKTQVKIDANGHMFGSVSAQDVVVLFREQLNIELEKRNVALPKPIKKLGVHEIDLKLKEGVAAKITLEVTAEEQSGK